jgi:ABC-type glycerol-3-phosphate transport system substrate-binding protein
VRCLRCLDLEEATECVRRDGMKHVSGSRWVWIVGLLALGIIGLQGVSAQKTVTWLHIWGAGVEHEQITNRNALFEAQNTDVKVE